MNSQSPKPSKIDPKDYQIYKEDENIDDATVEFFEDHQYDLESIRKYIEDKGEKSAGGNLDQNKIFTGLPEEKLQEFLSTYPE